MTTGQFLLFAWTWNTPAFLIGVVSAVAYVARFGFGRRIGYFAAALGMLWLTLMSPINMLADGYLFSAHMLQHIVLLLVIPALILQSLPRSLSMAAIPRAFKFPFFGWAAGVGAMWFWHVPALCNAAVSSRPVHALQTVSLLVLGFAFWRPILAPQEEERLSPPGAVVYLFSACVTCSVLGIIVTFSPVTVCSIYTLQPLDPTGMLHTIRTNWGFTPERDQQVGGLLMWVPMCLIYLFAILAQLARWFAESASPLREVR
jgi:putative membrane protein